MDAQQFQALLSSGAFLFAFFVGLDSSIWLKRRYDNAKGGIEERNRPIFQVIVLASWMITAAAGWIGAIAAFRLVFDAAIPWTPPITLGIATAIVFIPRLFKWAIRRVMGDDDI